MGSQAKEENCGVLTMGNLRSEFWQNNYQGDAYDSTATFRWVRRAEQMVPDLGHTTVNCHCRIMQGLPGPLRTYTVMRMLQCQRYSNSRHRFLNEEGLSKRDSPNRPH